MPEYYCTSCDFRLTREAINLAEGVALCPSCGALSRLSELVDSTRPSKEVINNPPGGCTVRDLLTKTRVRVSTRSFTGFMGAAFFTLFWNGIVSVFLAVAIGGLYTNLVGPLPAWFPGPSDDGMPLGMTIFLCIFLIPFVAVGVGMAWMTLQCLAGRIDIDIAPDSASVRTGVGPLVWTRRFDPRKVERVTIGRSKVKSNDEYKQLIEVRADRTVRFGSGLSDAKLEWLREVLRGLLLPTRR